MGDFKDDMSAEKKPTGIIPEGHRAVRILEMMQGVSKAGNRQFITIIEDVKTKTNMTLYLVSEPKKRWVLKSLLSACNLPASADGVYDWSVSDVLGQVVTAIIDHYQEPWVNREGVEVMIKKAKINEFLPLDIESTQEEVAWKE